MKFSDKGRGPRGPRFSFGHGQGFGSAVAEGRIESVKIAEAALLTSRQKVMRQSKKLGLFFFTGPRTSRNRARPRNL
jgi:hypothetical protein